jgi:hypothetical protein
MYAHTLSSISGDDLTLKPNAGKNLILEVSGNNSVFFKQGTNVFDLTNLSGGTTSIVSISNIMFTNLDISANLNPLVTNGSSIGVAYKNWNNAYINNTYCDTINTQYITHYTQIFANSLWNIIGQDISFSNSIVFFGISNNGRVVALTEPANASNRGRLYVYEISFNGINYSWQTLGLSSEIMVGQTTNTLFGGDGNSVVSLSSDGRVVAVSDTLNDTSGTDTGQVRVFELSANRWVQRGQLINGKSILNYKLGYNVALSGNGNILAASSRLNKGEVLVYELSANSWIRIGQDISGANNNQLGFSMSLSLDGTILAAGYRSSTLVEIYRFNSSSRTWTLPLGSIIDGSAIDQYFGWNIKLSGDGNTIVVGGIGYGAPAGNTSNGIGSVSVFRYNGTSWSQLGQTLYGASANDLFGAWVQISNDGTIISAGGSINYVRVYKLSSNTWTQLGQVLNGTVGHALSGDGTTLFQIITKTVGNFSRVYGMNKTIDNMLTLNSNTLMISGEVITNRNLNPFTNNTSSLGSASKIWGNAYIRDLSISSIEVSGNIIPSRRLDISSNLGSSLKRWSTLFANDLSINKINGQVYNASTFSVLTTVSSNIIPISNNTLRLGDVSNNWGNAYIRDLSVSSIDVSLNLNPLLNNSASLGLTGKIWGNAYIRDISVGSIDVSSNSINSFIANGSSLGLPTRMWGNGYIRDVSISSIDVSSNSITPLLANGSSLGLIGRTWNNAYIRDMSVSSIDVSSNINPLLVNSGSLGLPTRSWGNAYIRDMSVSSIDLSVNLNPLNANSSNLGLSTRPWNNAYIRDMSISSIDVSSNLTPLIPNRSSLGLPSKIWGNAYIRDLSISNIDVSGNIIPLIANNSNLGSSLNRWRNVFAGDLSVNNINGQPYTSGGGGGSSINLSSISGNIIPSTTNSLNLGSNTNYWNNVYIRNLVTSSRAYQGISGDISGGNFGDITWSAVNGYYGLAKDAYPSLNPLSSGVLAVNTWTARTMPIEAANYYFFSAVCWSPELTLFVAISGDNDAVLTSTNGVVWSFNQLSFYFSGTGVCWSPELGRFVAVSYDTSLMTSTNGKNWTQITQNVPLVNWTSVCWSSQLRLFVAVANGGSAPGRIIISKDGTTWNSQMIPVYSSPTNFSSVCWSAELGIFVAMSGSADVATSNNGINWTKTTIGYGFYSVCWSKELGIFVTIGYYGYVATSSNGINWNEGVATAQYGWTSVCWSSQLKLFVAVSETGSGSTRVITSSNGINWTSRNPPQSVWKSICWSPELGIFVAVGNGSNRVMTSSLKGRPPTSYNMFDSSFNRIDEFGRWDFSNIEVTRLTVKEIVVSSDDRLKHNEVAITNGLTIIDRLVPKFYQKTFDMLDASYNGDLSGYAWNYEAGLIAQEVLQISDLSYVVSSGDYYEKIIKYYDTSSNYEPRINYYDTSANYINRAAYYDISTNYEISYNLVTQSYDVNYNSLLTYGLAAIKELHAKVKAQEQILLEQQATINSLAARLQALEANNI